MYDIIKQAITLLTDSKELIQYGGLSLLGLVVFAETGLIFGFIFAGDYLLFTAGLLCGIGVFKASIVAVTSTIAVMAILGSIVGYYTGLWAGEKLMQKPDSYFFKKAHVEKTKVFYEKYGIVTLLVGRFLPIIRTFSPIFAGIICLPFPQFLWVSIVGAVLWSLLAPLGYFLGVRFPQIINYLEYIILFFIVITSIPVFRFFKKI